MQDQSLQTKSDQSFFITSFNYPYIGAYMPVKPGLLAADTSQVFWFISYNIRSQSRKFRPKI